MPTISIQMDVTGIPHTFVTIDNGSGNPQTYGFAPAAPNSPRRAEECNVFRRMKNLTT